MRAHQTETMGCNESSIKKKTYCLDLFQKKLQRAYTTSLTEELKVIEQKKKIHLRGIGRRKHSKSEMKSTK